MLPNRLNWCYCLIAFARLFVYSCPRSNLLHKCVYEKFWMIFLPGSSAAWERCMNRSQQFTVRCPSGLRSTPGKCVSVNSVSRVRIPLSPPYFIFKSSTALVSSRFLRDWWGAVDKWVDILDTRNIHLLKAIAFTFLGQSRLILDVSIQNHALSNH